MLSYDLQDRFEEAHSASMSLNFDTILIRPYSFYMLLDGATITGAFDKCSTGSKLLDAVSKNGTRFTIHIEKR